MKVSGERVSNVWATCLCQRDNSRKRLLIRYMTTAPHGAAVKDFIGQRWAHIPLGSWWDNSPPSRRWVAELRGWSATLGLKHGPDSYGRQQWGILGNGGNSDPATPRGGRRFSDWKPLSQKTKEVTVFCEEAPANYVPAAAVFPALSPSREEPFSVPGSS